MSLLAEILAAKRREVVALRARLNARDLDTLSMDAPRAARVLAALPAGVVSIHLSGLRDPSDVARVACTTADAALVGEALMRLDDPRALLREMTRAAHGAAATRAQ